MSNPKRLNDNAPRVYQWTTDKEPCEGLPCGEHSALLVEVRGDLAGGKVQFRGGLTAGEADDLALLDETGVTPVLIRLPAVGYLLPVTDAVGITISLKGLP